MTSNVIQFPGKRKRAAHVEEGLVTEEEVVRTPTQLFQFSDNGIVDLAEGVTVTDAVQALWEALQEVVSEAWAGHPLGRERARVLLLCRYLDKVRPGWREELAWQGV